MLWDSEKLENSEEGTIEESIVNKYMSDWYLDYNDTKNINARKITADLLNVNVWTGFFGDKSKGIEAIGTPTLEMLVKSWNQNGYIELKTEHNDMGYFIGQSSVESLADIAEAQDYEYGGYGMDLTKQEGMSNYELYFPYTEMEKECYGYWVASPNSIAEEQGMAISSVAPTGCIAANGWVNSTAYSIRPLVSVPLDLIIKDVKGNFKVAQ